MDGTREGEDDTASNTDFELCRKDEAKTEPIGSVRMHLYLLR
jgi:hypothetical protein